MMKFRDLNFKDGCQNWLWCDVWKPSMVHLWYGVLHGSKFSFSDFQFPNFDEIAINSPHIHFW